MKYLVVGIANDNDLATWIGKKTGENGVTVYNRKVDNTSLTILTPTNLQDKFYALGEILTLADIAIISTKTLDVNLGESIMAASLLGKEVILTNDNDISGILGKIKLSYKVIEKEKILDELVAKANLKKINDELLIEIDKVFPVKGVGLVLLGIVKSGTVKVHDKLYTRTGKEVQIRSIQVQDEDKEMAEQGTRVGLAIKGVEEKDIEKGEILAKKQIKAVSEIEAELDINPLQKELSEETQYTLIRGFDTVPCKITKVEGNKVKIRTGKTIQINSNECSLLIIREHSPKILSSLKIL
ncbi:MAG: EF-Tu/IF-2/RF-3 family GTPase [Candidatus Micrarchaeaceae archaeon]